MTNRLLWFSLFKKIRTNILNSCAWFKVLTGTDISWYEPLPLQLETRDRRRWSRYDFVTSCLISFTNQTLENFEIFFAYLKCHVQGRLFKNLHLIILGPYFITVFCKKNQLLQICNCLKILKVEHKSFPMMYHLSYLNIKHGIIWSAHTELRVLNLMKLGNSI